MINVKEFKNPSVKYRSIPFWSLNGKLTKEELKKQILNMKKMGFGGAFLHSRTGLETEYLSDEWMELMDFCKDVLLEEGMLVYLYDEDRYPSGTCGGLVTSVKEFKEKSMNYFEVTDFVNFKKPEDFIALFKVKLGSNGKCLSYEKIDDFTNVKEGERVFCYYVYYMPDDPFYNGNCMIDAMNKDATKYFLETTHEKYKERFGHLFGTDIKGIFTDEPCRGPMFSGFTHIRPNSEKLIPYTYVLFEEFYKRCGYKLEDNLPVLWFGLENDIFAKVTYDYVEILEELFLENFAKPYADWCTENKLKFTGHILHEDNLAAQTTMSGSMMRFYEYFDYPGMDNLGMHGDYYTVPTLVNSVCKQLGKDYLLDELYGVSGWPARLEDYKRIGDWQSALGVTFRVPHLCWYTMKGEAKRDCPASIFHQSSWYLDYRNIEDYFARLTYLIKEGKDTTKIAIINPIESTWGIANEYSYAGFTVAKEENYVRLEKEYAELYKALAFNGVPSDYIDEGLFKKYGSVGKDGFTCGKMSYKTIILNGNINLRKTTLTALKEFIALGGDVIVLGNMPTYLDGNRYDFSEDLNGARHIEFDTDKLLTMLDRGIVRSNCSNLLLVNRQFKDDLFVFAINKSSSNENVLISVKTSKKPVVLNLRTGEINTIKYSFKNNEVIIEKEFAPDEELALYFSDEEIDTKDNSYDVGEEVNIDQDYKYELLEDNFLVLNRCSLYLDEELISEKLSIFADIDLRNKLGIDVRGNQMLQPWFQDKFYPDNKNYGKVRLHYEFNVEYIPTELKLMFELQNDSKILVNGNEVDLSNIKESEIDCCFSLVNIDTSFLKNGKNTLDVVFDYHYRSNIEDHYLMGKFGVLYNEKIDTITKLPETLKPGSVNEQGLPYFGGKLNLLKNIDNGQYEVSVDNMGPACMNVNGKPIISKPYKTVVDVNDNKLNVELAFTRENTFGIVTVSNIIEGLHNLTFAPIRVRKIK